MIYLYKKTYIENNIIVEKQTALEFVNIDYVNLGDFINFITHTLVYLYNLNNTNIYQQ